MFRRTRAYLRAERRAERRFEAATRYVIVPDSMVALWNESERLCTALESAILGPKHAAVRSGQPYLIRRAARVKLGLES